MGAGERGKGLLMGLKRKILFSFCIAVLVVLSFLGGLSYYYYTHPNSIKPLFEKSISRATGSRCTIKILSYSFRPLRIRAEGVTLIPSEESRGFHLRIPDITVEMEIKGPMGARTLVVKNLKIRGASFQLDGRAHLPTIPSKGGRALSRGWFLRWAMKVFLFKDMEFGEARLTDGNLLVRLPDLELEIQNMTATLNPARLIEVHCSAQVKYLSQKISFQAGELTIRADRTVSFVNPVLKGSITANQAVLHTLWGDVEEVRAQSEIHYSHGDRLLSLEPLRVQGRWPGTDLSLTSRARLHIGKGVLDVSSISLNLPDILAIQGAGEARLNARSTFLFNILESRLMPGKAFDVIPVDLKKDMPPLPLSGPVQLRGTLEGRQEKEGWALKPDLQITLSRNPFLYRDNAFQLQGVITGVAKVRGTSPELAVTLQLEVEDTAISGRGFSTLKVGGPLRFNGALQGTGVGERWQWHTDVSGRLDESPFSYQRPGIGLRGRMSGDLHMKGSPSNPRLFASLEFDRTTVASAFTAKEPVKGRLVVEGEEGVYRLRDCSLDIPSLRAPLGQRDVAVRDIRIVCPAGTFNPRKGLLLLPEVRIDTSLVKNILLSLKREKGRAVIDMRGKETGLLATARSLEILPKGWRWEGQDRFQISASSTNMVAWRVKARVEFQGLTFEDPTSRCIGEKVSLITGFTGEILPGAGTFSAKASLEAGGGEFLYDRFYFDLDRTPLSVSLEGGGDTLKRTATVSRGRLRFKDIVALHLEGDVQARDKVSGAVFLKIPQTPLKSLFEHFVSEPFQTMHPLLAEFQVGGILSAELELRGSPGEWTATGVSRLRQGFVSSQSIHMAARGIDLDLPVWLETRTSELREVPLRGKLSIQELVLPFLENKALNLPLEARPNMLVVTAATNLTTPGGDVEVGPVFARDLLSADRSLRTSLTFNKLRVAPLLEHIWPRHLEGEIQGRLDPLAITNKRLTSAGQVLFRVFNGKIRFHDLSVTNPFSSMPVLGLNAEWQDLSLEKITAETPFGKVEGILQGYVKDLEIADGQPQRFELFLETVKTKGVDQKISHLAIKNIAQVAGGENASMGISGMLAFLLKNYESPYKKIGIKASLKNDRFRINGTIHEQGKEYLIKRPWHSGVDVINWEPDNSISFKTMIKRIKNVTLSSERGPIMNEKKEVGP